jgi:proline iminopeptidase
MFAKVNGYNLFFDVEGLQFVPDGPIMREKPVCLVLHGGPFADHSHYMPDLSPLSNTMQLVYIDDRNTGRSEHIDYHTNSIKQNVDDVEAVRKYLGLDKVFVLGQSYGGMKAQRYAIDYSQNLYGVIIVDTAPNAECIAADRVAKHVMEYGTAEQYETWTSGALQTGKITFTEYLSIMGPLYHGNGKFDFQAAYDSNQRVIKNDEGIAFQFGPGGELSSMDTFNLVPELSKVSCPSTIIVGEQDFICDVASNSLIHDSIPGSEFHIIPGASHEVFADCPELVFPIINDFVDRNFIK